jgi:hypothetical protein
MMQQLIVTFGNITNSGTSKIKAIAKGKEYEFAKRQKFRLRRITSMEFSPEEQSVMTQHGFIEDEKKAIDAYKDHTKDLGQAF